MLRSNSNIRKEQVTPSSRSLYRRGRLEKLEDRNLLASVPWNEVTDLSVPFGLSGAGAEWRGSSDSIVSFRK